MYTVFSCDTKINIYHNAGDLMRLEMQEKNESLVKNILRIAVSIFWAQLMPCIPAQTEPI